MSEKLLQTKLFKPTVRPLLVPRPRLIEKLNVGLDGKLTLVSAPAGFGKTTLVATWILAGERPSAWLSLDERDNDLMRFWHYLLAAFRDGLQEESWGAEIVLGGQRPMEEMVAGFVNGLTAAATPLTLVLDDYHVIDSQAIHQSLAFFLDQLPPNLHLVISSRSSPPLPLPRLRVRHQLNELTPDALRFTPEETAVFLNEIMGLNIAAEDVAALEQRTEGWIAGLQVAALSLQGRSDKTAFIQQFSGSHRHLLDYLAEEVLSQQPPAVQKFLLCTAILSQFNAPLCDAVLENSDWKLESDPLPFLSSISNYQSLSQAILDRVEQANLFLISLDDERRWYRYHHLFADFLQSRLQKVAPAIVPELHHRASVWLEANGFWETAVDHAIAARLFERAIQLIRQFTDGKPAAGMSGTIFRWLQQMPNELIRAQPQLSLALAWGYCHAGRYQASKEWVAAAEAQGQTSKEVQGEIAAVYSIIACYQGDVTTALTRSREALALLPQENHMLRGLIANNIAMNLDDAISGSGDLAAAAQIYAEVAAAGRAANDEMVEAFGMNRLAQLQVSQGMLHRAANTFRQVLQLGLARAERPLSEISLAHFNLAQILYQWNELDAAQQHLQAGDHGENGQDTGLLTGGYALRIFLAQALGETAAAQSTLAEATAIARKTNISWIISGMAATGAKLALMQDDLQTAVRWAETCGLAVGDDIGVHRIREYATLAEIYVAQEETDKALALLTWLIGFATRLELTGSVLSLMVGQSLALLAAGNVEKAAAVLADTLALAEPEGYVRLFVDAGQPMARLLRQVATKGVMRDYAGQLLAAFPNASSDRPAQPLLDPLSERELEVLGLLADGRSNPEIAAELFLAVGTVKRHLHNIFGKLNVANRRQAVMRANELNLL